MFFILRKSFFLLRIWMVWNMIVFDDYFNLFLCKCLFWFWGFVIWGMKIVNVYKMFFCYKYFNFCFWNIVDDWNIVIVNYEMEWKWVIKENLYFWVIFELIFVIVCVICMCKWWYYDVCYILYMFINKLNSERI